MDWRMILVNWVISDPFARYLNISGFSPAKGTTSLAKLSHEDWPSFFIGIGRISLAMDSSSEQHDFWQLLLSLGIGTKVLNNAGEVGDSVVRIGFATDGVDFVAGRVGFMDVVVGFIVDVVGFVVNVVGFVAFIIGLVAERVGLVEEIVGTGFSNEFPGKKGSSTILLGTDNNGGLIGGLLFLKTCTTLMGIGSATEETSISDPLQPSGKKYLMFSLLCLSSLKSPTNEAFLKLTET